MLVYQRVQLVNGVNLNQQTSAFVGGTAIWDLRIGMPTLTDQMYI